MNESDYMAAIDAANHKQLLTAHQAVAQERDAMKIEIDRLQKNLSSKTEIANQLKDNLVSSFEAQAALRAQVEQLRKAAKPLVDHYFNWTEINEPDFTCDHNAKLHSLYSDLNNALRKTAKGGE